VPERFHRRLRDERGVTIVMVAIFLPVLVLFAGLAIDTANWWVHKRHLQIQADASALAGATAYRFPVCDDSAIQKTAIEYSGGRDPDNAGIAPLHNFQRGRTTDPPEPIHTEINEPTFWGDTDPVDDDLVGSPSPCATKFIDVKMTEQNAPGFFTRAFIPEIDAQARVSLKQLQSFAGLLPIGVEDVNPVRVHVWMYDEDSGALLGEAELRKRATTENGVYVWDNALGNGDALPILVDNVTAERMSFRVALSGNADTITCNDPLVICYGYKAPIPEDPGKTFDRGLPRVRGYDVTGTAPRLGEVALFPATCGANALLDGGYFATTCTAIDVTADLRGVQNTGNNAATVEAFIKDGNKENRATLSWDDTLGLWTGTLSVTTGNTGSLGTGPLPVRIAYDQSRGSLENGTNCTNRNPCSGAFTDAHAHFSGARYWSGPIKHMQINTATATNVNNVRRCVGGASACTESFVVRIGVGGRLELSDQDDDPTSLRVFGSGSQNQSLDCDPDVPGFEDEIAEGCQPEYTLNTGQKCLPHNVLWASPQPWNCVVVQTGTATSKPSKGLNERILCASPDEANCKTFGKAQSCTQRNKWWDYPLGDRRIVPVFLVPFGTFDAQGTMSVPVIDFAFFYVTGWHGNGGFENPCQTENPSYEDFVPGTEDEQGVMSGHFIKYIAPNTGGSGTEPCDFNSIGGCVAVMTK